MRIDLTPEQESQVREIAALAGRDVGEVAGEMFSRFLVEEARFIAAVERGEAELDEGDFLTHEDVGVRVRRYRHSSRNKLHSSLRAERSNP